MAVTKASSARVRTPAATGPKVAKKSGAKKTTATKKTTAAKTPTKSTKSAPKNATKKAAPSAASPRAAQKAAPTKSAAPKTKAPIKKPTKKAAPQSAPTSAVPETPKKAPSLQSRFTAQEITQIRATLIERREALSAEHNKAMTDLAELQGDRTTEGAGDDQADTGTKNFEREQELTLANGILERVNQIEHALERLDKGNYGQCERCGETIPKARLEAFPAATLCVKCKQLEERR
jgi:RNA polymerase-binding protein DksA